MLTGLSAQDHRFWPCEDRGARLANDRGWYSDWQPQLHVT